MFVYVSASGLFLLHGGKTLSEWGFKFYSLIFLVVKLLLKGDLWQPHFHKFLLLV